MPKPPIRAPDRPITRAALAPCAARQAGRNRIEQAAQHSPSGPFTTGAARGSWGGGGLFTAGAPLG